MIYLQSFDLMSRSEEQTFIQGFRATCFNSFFPFGFFTSGKDLSRLEFDDITIFCGGNGSGKTTLLNIIAEKLALKRQACYNKTYFFGPYLEGCQTTCNPMLDSEQMVRFMSVSRIITSDEVFDHIISVRHKNEHISMGRSLIFCEDDLAARFGTAIAKERPRSINMDDPKSVKAYIDFQTMARKSVSRRVRDKVGMEERTFSNGENGFNYFTEAIQPGGLYLLDEPENSLSAEMQLQLVHFLHGMTSLYDCQFVLSSHSPFVLSMPGAKIYNLDAEPVATCRWTDLPNVRIYHDFFEAHRTAFMAPSGR